MKIIEVINKIKAYSRGIDAQTGKQIDDEKTRDQVLFGSTDKECTGIVTTCFASVDVIEEAHRLGCNLIIPHEALFWNHGDHTDFLEEQKNKVFLRKKALLEEYGITVWRNHDYIHSGVPNGKGGRYDGIFKGFLYYTGLEQYYVMSVGEKVRYQINQQLVVPGLTVEELARKIIDGAGLNGVRIVGDPKTVVNNVMIPMHILGYGDNHTIEVVDQRNVDCLLALECIDYTVNEYMRDGAMLGDPKAIIIVGHFNMEEPGMKYMLNWLPEALGEEVPMHFVKSGDASTYILK